MSTINSSDTASEHNSSDKYSNRPFTTFDKIGTVFAGAFLVVTLFYYQFTTVSQEEINRITALKSQLTSQESKDAFDQKARVLLKDKRLTEEEKRELAEFSDQLIAQERLETVSFGFAPAPVKENLNTEQYVQ